MPKIYKVEEILSLWDRTFYQYNLPLEKEKLFIKVEYQNKGNLMIAALNAVLSISAWQLVNVIGINQDKQNP